MATSRSSVSELSSEDDSEEEEEEPDEEEEEDEEEPETVIGEHGTHTERGEAGREGH